MGEIGFTWWNLENFFDTDNDPISKDFNYTPEKGWTDDAFYAKKCNLAKVLAGINSFRPIDLLAVCEIEKDSLLEDLIEEAGCNLEVVWDEQGTSDLRGIDVAMAFNPAKLELMSVKSHLVHLRYPTRDIIEVTLKVRETGEPFTVIATHLPSRRNGQYDSEPNRIMVSEHIAKIVESNTKFTPEEYQKMITQERYHEILKKWDSKILIAGDFNDSPYDRSILKHLKASGNPKIVTGNSNRPTLKETVWDYRGRDCLIYNGMWRFLSQNFVGTYYYQPRAFEGQSKTLPNPYQVLDQVLCSRGLLKHEGLTMDPGSVEIYNSSLNCDERGIPIRFNKKKKQGSSDHLPLTAVLKY